MDKGSYKVWKSKDLVVTLGPSKLSRFFDPMFRFLLAPFAFLYGVAVTLRNKFFDWGWLKSEEFDIPIVCVGNLTVGGTGKTPFSEFLIERLAKRYCVALLSLGYRRRTKGFVEVAVNSSFLKVGDEAKQIKLKFPDIVVAVCEKRAEGIRRIRELHPEVNLIILDDGFQHRAVEPWVNIILMDYTRPIYHDHLLPWGTLRDPVSQLHRAHFVIVTKCPLDMNALDQRIVIKSLGLFPYQGLWFTRTIAGSVTPLFPDVAPEWVLAGDPVIVMAGIARPEPLIRSLGEEYNIVDTLIFRDHHPYRMRDLQKMERALAQAPPGTVIITTEKDAVKLTNRKRIPISIQRALHFIPIKTVFCGEGEKNFLQRVEKYVDANQKYSLLHS